MAPIEKDWEEVYDGAMRLLVFLLAIVIATPVATAAVGANDAAAKKHFEDGTTAFNLGDFRKAVEEYKAAYQLRPDSVFLYNIAQSYRQANDLPNALFFYKSYVRNSPNAPNKGEVERRIEALEKEIAHQKEMANTPPNGTVTPAGEAPPPSTAPAVTEPATTSAKSEPERGPLYKKWWLWTAVGGVVVVGVALGVGLGVGLNAGNGEPSSHFGTSKFFLVAP